MIHTGVRITRTACAVEGTGAAVLVGFVAMIVSLQTFWSEPGQGLDLLASARTFWHTENTMSNTVGQKRRGRPPTGEMPRIAIRLPESFIARLDAHAEAHGMTRTQAMRRILYDALPREKEDVMTDELEKKTFTTQEGPNRGAQKPGRDPEKPADPPKPKKSR